MIKPERFLSAPIPGQSLTDTPKNYAWERPPEMADYQEVTKMYINRLADQDVMDDLAVVFDGGMPISPFVDALTTMGVGEGLHSVDVKLIVSPVIHAFIKAAMLEYGIEARDEAYDPKKDPTVREKRRLETAIQLALVEAQNEDRTAETDPGVNILQKISDSMSGEDTGVMQEDDAELAPMVEEEATPPAPEEEPRRGLMARGGM